MSTSESVVAIGAEGDRAEGTATGKREWLSFLTVTVVVLPGLTVGLIGAYGLLIWLTQ